MGKLPQYMYNMNSLKKWTFFKISSTPSIVKGLIFK